MKRKSKEKPATENKGRGTAYDSRTINVFADKNERIARVMKLEGITNFTQWANSALADRCRKTEREHGIDAEGNPLPVKNSAENPPKA